MHLIFTISFKFNFDRSFILSFLSHHSYELFLSGREDITTRTDTRCWLLSLPSRRCLSAVGKVVGMGEGAAVGTGAGWLGAGRATEHVEQTAHYLGLHVSFELWQARGEGEAEAEKN